MARAGLACQVREASCIARWTYARMLAPIPTPGHAVFEKLVSKLVRHGLDPSGLSVDTPSNRASDVSVNFDLRHPELRLRVMYSGFEIIANRVTAGFLQDIPGLASGVAEDLRVLAGGVSSGQLGLIYSSHLEVAEGAASTFLQARFALEGQASCFVPDALGYLVHWPERADVKLLRAVVARSARLHSGLYVELTFNYDFEELSEAVCRVVLGDVTRVVGDLGFDVTEGAM